MKIKFTSNQIPQIVRLHILPLLKSHRILAFSGPLGAGKTTLIKELLKQCGISSTVTSPTFSYLNTYYGDQEFIYHHFDLYRITTPESFIHAGFDEYLHQENAWCLIEWPEVIDPILKSKNLTPLVCQITLSYNKENFLSREIEIKN